MPAGFELVTPSATNAFTGSRLENLQLERRWFGWYLTGALSPPFRLRRLGRGQAEVLERSLERRKARARAAGDLADAVAWHELVNGRVNDCWVNHRWIPEETISDLMQAKPRSDLFRVTKSDRLLASTLTETESAAVNLLGADFRGWVAMVNERILDRELRNRRGFFDKVEKSPLTQEQSRAVACFDNRVHVIAAAGSGKTSVMVARAAYAVERGFVAPDRILLLAFNKNAASELQERVDQRFAAAGIDSSGVRASTFHSFGLSVLGEARGRKPRLAPWLDRGEDVAMVMQIVDELRDSSIDFRFKWDMFRLLYARMAEEPDGGEADSYDRETHTSGFRTFAGETVKSQGERLVADWLYLNGVRYDYERAYVHDTADAQHGEYRPDFYYPELDVWHEHWALDRAGRPPASFSGYAESMAWKRATHRQYGTPLIETTWAGVMDRTGFETLAGELTSLGATLDWNPDRPTPGARPVKHDELARLIRTFMAHVKSSSLTQELLNDKLERGPDHFRTPRTRLFLELYWAIHRAWQQRLDAGGYVDFEDMLVDAAKALEEDKVTPGYDLVMVDEFQDASQARARLTRALVKGRGKYLLAVGDDWQSINRFAGADISVMTDFENWFGTSQTLRLQTTFRSPQSVSDTASDFVSKNPRQLRKQVRSSRPDPGPQVRLLYAHNGQPVREVVLAYLRDLQTLIVEERPSTGTAKRPTVHILGRYGFDREHAPRHTPPGLDVRFRTVHSSKGLEADYVVLPNVSRGIYGFPSQIADDPVLDLVMADPDEYAHAEERRLFYVALTRARREVVLIAERGNESPFAIELIQDGQLDIVGLGGERLHPKTCPVCADGMLVGRKGPYGLFFGCSAFPRCRHTEPAPRS